MSDWIYAATCGCKVTLFGASNYKTSRLIPAPNCKLHTLPGQDKQRDTLILTAKGYFNTKNDLKTHARESTFKEASREFQRMMDELDDKYDLSIGELNMLLSSHIQRTAKYTIRFERHGNTDTPGGLENNDE